MYKLKSGIAYITAAAVIVALWVYWISNRVSVSVIVPVYNSEKFLSRCLDSIVAQKGSFEIIAVNDGSTDKSGQILEAYAQKYKNIIVVNQENKGVSAARNQGMAKANGKYITFVDSDDWLEPDALARAVSILRQDSPDILLVGFYDVYDHEWVRRTGGEASHRYAKNFLEKYNDIALLADLMGHESIETTRIYLRRTASEQQALVDKIVTW